MRTLLYITILALSLSACGTAHNYAMEDDIYYIPGKKSLVIKEVEKITETKTPLNTYHDDTYAYEAKRSQGSSIAPKAFTQRQEQYNQTTEKTDNPHLIQQSKADIPGYQKTDETNYQDAGYWIGGYKGNERDFDEIQRIINMYPNGFAFFNGNGYDIAMNLSFDTDWNVYTDNGRYWWFPSNSNIELYSSLLFGTYPKYIWTIIWDRPYFDRWAFDHTFNNHFGWGFNFGWGGPGWNLGFGYNSYWYDPWYDSYHPHWNRPQHPLAGQRPNYGGGVSGIRPNGQSGHFPNRPTMGRRSSYRPNTSGRPSNHSNSMTKPGTITRPTSRPNTSNILRPGTSNRHNSAVRPNTTTRPTTTRRRTTTQQSLERPGTQSNKRPNTMTRPTTTRSTNNYSRPTNNHRPIYNNNTSNRSTYTPRRNSTGGGNTSGGHRPVRRR